MTDLKLLVDVPDFLARRLPKTISQVFDYDPLPHWVDEYETFVYVVQETTGLIKIGTSKDPCFRISQLQVGNPRELTLICCWAAKKVTEEHIHYACRYHNVRGEWFTVDAIPLVMVRNPA